MDIERANEQIDTLTRENKILRDELAILKQGLFGRRTERIEPGQLGIFGDLAKTPEPTPEPEPKSKRKPKPGHGRAPFPAHLPREVIELDVDEAERFCPDCGAEMSSIGEDVCERGHIVPARLVVRRYVRKKYACPQGHAVKTAKPIDGVIDGGKYEASVYAHIATCKYADHLPLHRLEGIFKRYGVHIPKQSMWDMLVRIDELVAQPVLEQMRAEMLAEPVLHSDETPVTLRLENGKGSRTGYAWGWRNLQGAGTSKVLIEFKTSRGRDGPIDFLGDWSGTLIADGYAGFDEVVRNNEIVRAGCWAHARRKFKEALDTGSKSAARLLDPIQKLFGIERSIKQRAEDEGLDREGLIELRRAEREQLSQPLVDEILVLADGLSREHSTLPKSKLGKALGYLLGQRVPLSAFLDDPRIPIHNNDSERDLRHLAVGRKNWMIFASERGGHVACRLYSLVLSCKQSGIDPEAYIEDVLMKVATTPASEIASLTPWGWAAARATATTVD
jgi:transposase